METVCVKYIKDPKSEEQITQTTPDNALDAMFERAPGQVETDEEISPYGLAWVYWMTIGILIGVTITVVYVGFAGPRPRLSGR